MSTGKNPVVDGPTEECALDAAKLGGSAESGLPQNVADPTVVLAALEEGGIACSGTAVSGNVATCNARVAVRVFAAPEVAAAMGSEAQIY